MTNRQLHIIMPMAGEGSRFVNEGWTTPKPLIDLDGKCLFERAIDSVRIDGIDMKYSFIVRQEHIERYDIEERIKVLLPEANVFSVTKTTRGAVETCMIAEPVIADNDVVVVMDCDLEFRSEKYLNYLECALSQSVDKTFGGVLVSFESNDPRYSYAAVDERMCVLRTAEKEAISSHALCGAYAFASGRDFKRVAKRLLNDGTSGKAEFYVLLLYNYLLSEGKEVYLAPMEEYYSYGTPEELKRYL